MGKSHRKADHRENKHRIPVLDEAQRILAFWDILMSYITEIHKESCQDLQLKTYGRIPTLLCAALSSLRIKDRT